MIKFWLIPALVCFNWVLFYWLIKRNDNRTYGVRSAVMSFLIRGLLCIFLAVPLACVEYGTLALVWTMIPILIGS